MTTCPVHKGIRIDRQPCYRCGDENHRVDVAVKAYQVADTLNRLESHMPEPAPVTNLQPTLSDALFPPVRRADVPTVKVAIGDVPRAGGADQGPAHDPRGAVAYGGGVLW